VNNREIAAGTSLLYPSVKTKTVSRRQYSTAAVAQAEDTVTEAVAACILPHESRDIPSNACIRQIQSRSRRCCSMRCSLVSREPSRQPALIPPLGLCWESCWRMGCHGRAAGASAFKCVRYTNCRIAPTH
jgi:hypothetical protein